MAFVLISPPALEPVSLAELKKFLKIDAGFTGDDDDIQSLGSAARSWAEVYTNRPFVVQTRRLLMDFFPGYVDSKLIGQKVSSPFVSGANAAMVGIYYSLLLPYPPAKSIPVFQYLNANGTTTVMTSGTDYVQDIQSNPARLTPPFGQVWPVARVVPNAIQVDIECGYAMPLSVSSAGSPLDLLTVSAEDYIFQPSDVGRPISIIEGGPDGGTLNTIIASVSSPLATAQLRDAVSQPVTDADALLVNTPSGDPSHWPLIKSAIKMLTARWYDVRTPDETRIPSSVKAVLGPVRDLRL